MCFNNFTLAAVRTDFRRGKDVCGKTRRRILLISVSGKRFDTLEQGYGRIADRFRKVLGGKIVRTWFEFRVKGRGKKKVLRMTFGFLA